MILAATGLRREARLIASPMVRAVAGGGRAEALEAALLDAASGAEAVISIGLAGALAPSLRAADWIVAEEVVWPEGAVRADLAWSDALLRLPRVRRGRLLGSDAVVAGRAEKSAALARWAALAVDMESHIAARVAQRLAVPFAVARVVADAAELELPPAAAAGMSADGAMDGGAVLASVVRRPSQLPGLLRAALAAERAFRALADGRRLLGPRLGLPDLGELALDVG